ncbi:CD48 antigen-like isoform X2 [Equus przewalskii]|uniref:CD48 antigen-like isoform X2 n=1 Tax=Equus przewalskii TaxID=9798 RepID=A0ABM4NI71_EQUPR
MPQMSLLLGSQTVKDPSSSCTLQRTVGGSVQLQLTSSSSPDIREIEWIRDSGDERDLFLVSWKPNTSNPEWYGLEEKYKHRFSLTELAFLIIRNLSMQISELYTVKIKFRSGKSQEEAFRLCLYEPIPQPQIQIHPSSRTSGWCNISLECGTPGATENLAVTWLSKGLPRELEPRETMGPAPNSRNLSLSLALGQLNGHLTCMVSNSMDDKNATLHPENIYPSTEQTALERHPSHGSDGGPGRWSVDLDEEEDGDWERWVCSPAQGARLSSCSPGPSHRRIC